MPGDSYHGSDGRALGRRVHHMAETEKIQVSCERCGRTRTFGWETIKHYRRDCPVAWLEQMMPPSCYDLVNGMPADCVRRVVVFDGDLEDVGCSDEG